MKKVTWEKITLGLAILTLLVAIFCLLPNASRNQCHLMFGFYSLLSGTGLSIISFLLPSKKPTKLTCQFQDSHWQKSSSGDYIIRVKTNMRGGNKSPGVQVFQLIGDSYELIDFIYFAFDKLGTLTIRTKIPFDGKIEIS